MSEQDHTNVSVSIRINPVQLIAPRVAGFSLTSAQDMASLGPDRSLWWKDVAVDMGHEFGMMELSGQNTVFGRLTLAVSQEKNPGRVLPYELSITVVALFQVPEAIPEPDRVGYAFMYGWGQLHAFARYSISAMTAESPYGPCLLPAMLANSTDMGALEAAIARLEKDTSQAAETGPEEIAALLKQARGIERALDLGKGDTAVDELAKKFQPILDRLKVLESNLNKVET
jgi:hypothetical protein